MNQPQQNQPQMQLDVNHLLETYREENMRLNNDLVVSRAVIRQLSIELDGHRRKEAMQSPVEEGNNQSV